MDHRALVDDRIKTLLTSTDLTFKQIIEQLRSENISASFNSIRRVNRNHRYRKPRYDAKLNAQQRKELIVKLKNTARPNLSSLARHYGVCHGSIWYWWDKLTKIREKNNGRIPSNEPSLDIDDTLEHDYMSGGSAGADNRTDDAEDDLAAVMDPDSDQLDMENGNGSDYNEVNGDQYFTENQGPVKMIGPVQAMSNQGSYIKLPIVMYAPVSTPPSWKQVSHFGSPPPSRHYFNHYPPINSVDQTCTLNLSKTVR